MTATQFITLTVFTLGLSMVFVVLLGTLYCINAGEHEKAIYTSIVAAILAIILFAGMWIVF